MKKLILFLLFVSNLITAQMPNISNAWLNESKPYVGTIGADNQVIKLKINFSEQNKKNDQEYFLSGYTLVGNEYSKFEGSLTITKYKDSKKKGVVYGIYELAEENKGPHSGLLKGKFIYTFSWNKKTEKLENPYIYFIGDWKSYTGNLNYKTRLKNQ
ncbi:MAG: hypothetical protein KBS61_04810 [Chryseobacterium sp.]|nr:hypothetical protein [Candidatus Chryseobacterium enterohippi]